MATFIAIVKRDGDVGYTASFPDFPSCAVSAPTVDYVIARAREALSLHIERLLEANHRICDPTAADAIDRGDALLLAAVDVPDDLRIAHVDLAIPALSLARMDAFARRHGLTHAGLFVEAVNRWAMQETALTDRRASAPDGPTLFDLANPIELRVEPIAPTIEPQDAAGTREGEPGDERDVEARVDDITAELVRLLEQGEVPAQNQDVSDENLNIQFGRQNKPSGAVGPACSAFPPVPCGMEPELIDRVGAGMRILRRSIGQCQGIAGHDMS